MFKGPVRPPDIFFRQIFFTGYDPLIWLPINFYLTCGSDLIWCEIYLGNSRKSVNFLSLCCSEIRWLFLGSNYSFQKIKVYVFSSFQRAFLDDFWVITHTMSENKNFFMKNENFLFLKWYSQKHFFLFSLSIKWELGICSTNILNFALLACMFFLLGARGSKLQALKPLY